MMKFMYPPLTVMALVAIPALALAEPPSDKVAGDKSRKLPPPLEKISLNVLEFEEGGFFKVSDIRLGPAGYRNEDAVILTLHAEKTITYRHVEIYLRRFRDVQFYARRDDGKRFIHSTILVHSHYIAADAVNGEVLPEGSSIEVWFYLDRAEIQKLINFKADTIEFRPYRL
jgi:hypothetical protein